MRPEAEQVLCFGPDQRLVGLLNHRPSDAGALCLLLNVGVTSRIGPRRLNVKLARHLATEGISSFRIDLSGVGDSGAAGAGAGYQTQAVDDLRAAMDAAQAATGVRRFVVLGICSGAVNGYRVAQVDERVTGLMMYDGYAFPTWRTRIVHDWKRFVGTPPTELVRKVRQRVRRLMGLPVPTRPVSIFYVTRDETAPDERAYGDALDSLVQRGVAVLVAYSGSMLVAYNHAGQFADTFRGRAFLRSVQCRYLPQIDHIPTSLAGQREFLNMVRDWLRPMYDQELPLQTRPVANKCLQSMAGSASSDSDV